MPNKAAEETIWISVIGKALAYLCIQQVAATDPKRVGSLLDKVRFLEGIGVPKADAALILGSTANSVGVLERRKRKGGKRASKKR